MALRVFSIVTAIILMRILNPEDFGIVALAYVLLSTTGLFSGLGMGPAVIHSQEDRGQVAFHAFVITACSGTVLFLLIILNLTFFAGLLGDVKIVPVLQWMSALVLLGGLTIVPQSLLEKELMFGRVSIIVVAAELCYIILAVALAYNGFGLWSLVVASLLKAVATLSMSWGMFPGWEWIVPKAWDWQLTKRLMNYGFQAAGSGVVSYFYSIVDNFIVGRHLGEHALGVYSKAYDFTSRTVDGLNNVIGVVLFPSYAKIQLEKDRLSRAYLKSLRVISLFTIPMSMGIFVTAPEMVSTLLGEKWLPMIAPLQILAFMSLVKPLSATTAALFSSTGHPGFNLRAGILVTVVLVPTIFLLLGYGVSGVAVAVLIAHIIGFAFNIYQVHIILPDTASKMLTAIIPSLAGTIVMVVIVFLIKEPLRMLGGGHQTIPTLALMICAGVLVYGGTLLAIQRPLLTELFGMAMARFRSRQA
jgi:PST family polysaccharide transporter